MRPNNRIPQKIKEKDILNNGGESRNGEQQTDSRNILEVNLIRPKTYYTWEVSEDKKQF